MFDTGTHALQRCLKRSEGPISQSKDTGAGGRGRGEVVLQKEQRRESYRSLGESKGIFKVKI